MENNGFAYLNSSTQNILLAKCIYLLFYTTITIHWLAWTNLRLVCSWIYVGKDGVGILLCESKCLQPSYKETCALEIFSYNICQAL